MSSKYGVSKSVEVPSHALGVRIGRVDEHEVALVEEVAARLHDLVPHASARRAGSGAKVEVPVVEQELDAVVFRLDRVLGGEAAGS